jgi:hypothetical protein
MLVKSTPLIRYRASRIDSWPRCLMVFAFCRPKLGSLHRAALVSQFRQLPEHPALRLRWLAESPGPSRRQYRIPPRALAHSSGPSSFASFVASRRTRPPSSPDPAPVAAVLSCTLPLLVTKSHRLFNPVSPEAKLACVFLR